MIRSLKLASAPCFGDVAAAIEPFKPVTFVFGANRLGKMTLSRALDDPSRYPRTKIAWASPPAARGQGLRPRLRQEDAGQRGRPPRPSSSSVLGARRSTGRSRTRPGPTERSGNFSTASLNRSWTKTWVRGGAT